VFPFSPFGGGCVDILSFVEGGSKYLAFRSEKHRQSAVFTSCRSQERSAVPGQEQKSAGHLLELGASFRSGLPSLCPGAWSAGLRILPVGSKSGPSKTIGIDRGLKDLFVTPESERAGNSRHTARYAARLDLAQHQLSRKKLGSKWPIFTPGFPLAGGRLHKRSRRTDFNEKQVVCFKARYRPRIFFVLS